MLSAHLENNLWKGVISKWKILIVLRPEIIFPYCHDGAFLDHEGQGNVRLSTNMEEELMMEP